MQVKNRSIRKKIAYGRVARRLEAKSLMSYAERRGVFALADEATTPCIKYPRRRNGDGRSNGSLGTIAADGDGRPLAG
jgi:hypothetical protein